MTTVVGWLLFNNIKKSVFAIDVVTEFDGKFTDKIIFTLF